MIVRVTFMLAAALVAYALMRRMTTAASRHAMLIVALGATLFAALPLPTFHIAMEKTIAVSHALFARPRVGNVIAAWDRVAPRSRWPEIVWAIGAAVFALRIALAWMAALRLRAAATETFVWRGYRVVVGDSAPATIGRTILLPREWSEPMLMHEAAHVRRGDSFTRLIAQIACAVYWFHPLAWIASRLAMLEQERACDDAVIADGVAPLDYAEVLIRAARSHGHGAAPAMAAGELEARMRAIVDPRMRRGRAGWGAAVVAAMLSIAALGAPINFAYDDPLSEELPDVRVNVGDISSSPERAVIEQFVTLSKAPKTWEGNLVAQRARWALSQMRGGVIVAPVREALGDRDWRVRAYAAWSAAVARDTAAVPRLIELLDDPIWRMRAMAAAALHAIGDPRATAAMQRAAKDEHWQVRIEAEGFLEELR